MKCGNSDGSEQSSSVSLSLLTSEQMYFGHRHNTVCTRHYANVTPGDLDFLRCSDLQYTYYRLAHNIAMISI